MNEIQIFKNENFGEVRVAEVNGVPMFCLADVCRVLEIKNSRDCKSRLNPKGVGSSDILTEGGLQQATFISEGNLYKVIFMSRKPEAEAFQDWVTDEVLPSIRKTGSYNMPKTFAQALRLAAEQQEKIEAQQALIDVQKPKAEYYDTLVDRNSLTNIRDTSKAIGVKEKLFVAYLIGNGYLYRDNKKQLKPIAKYTGDDNLFVIKEFVNGSRTGMQTLITVKGKEYFTNKFNKTK